MEISGIGSTAGFYRYVLQRANSSGATFEDALAQAAEAEENPESCVWYEMKTLGELLTEVYKNRSGENPLEGSEEDEEKDYWEIRNERQKLLDEYFEKKELQRKAFEKLSVKRRQAREYFFSGEGVLFLHSAAAEVMGLL